MKETYFEWLADKVTYFDGPDHDDLLYLLHTIPYVAVISKDEDRAIDGLNLRNEYLEKYGGSIGLDNTPCTFLEFLVALAIRMNFIYARLDEDRTADCFWTMLQNAGIMKYEDYEFSEDYIRGAVERVIYRTYEQNGEGGLFPINEPRANQRNVEVWYQMNQYLTEAMRKNGRL